MRSNYISQIRSEKINARNSLSGEERKEFSLRIVDKLVNSEIFQKAETVMLYRFVKGEVQLNELENVARMQGKRLVYPLCINKTEMIALSPEEKASWKRGAFGIEEPDPEKSVIVDPLKIDLVICPCTAFDCDCNRIGMGGGYYDRFLPKCKNATVIAVAFEVQKISAILNRAWDIPMKYIITEDCIYVKSTE